MADDRLSAGSQVSSHDSVFRLVFGKPENAASQLRAVLPPDVAARLDLGRLAQVPGTLVDEALRQRHTDLLFSVPLDGQDAFVYVLMEHQSSSDPLMAYRMLRYVTRIWDRYLDEHPRVRKLPTVIPLVVYNGPGRWSAPRRLQDLIHPVPGGNDADWLPRFSFLLDDLAVIDLGQLRARDLTPPALVTLFVLKRAPGNPKIREELWGWTGELGAVLGGPGGLETFKALLTYIMNVADTPASEFSSLADVLGPDAKEALMTTAERLRVQGGARMLVQVLTGRFGTLPESVAAKVSEASAAQLEKWGIRAGTAKTLDEVFE